MVSRNVFCLSHLFSVLRIPIRMQGPLPTGEAGRPRPLIQADGTDTACIKDVPGMATVAEPAVAGRGRPVTFGATDARSGRTFGGEFFYLGLRRSRHGGHSHHYEIEKADR